MIASRWRGRTSMVISWRTLVTLYGALKSITRTLGAMVCTGGTASSVVVEEFAVVMSSPGLDDEPPGQAVGRQVDDQDRQDQQRRRGVGLLHRDPFAGQRV